MIYEKGIIYSDSSYDIYSSYVWLFRKSLRDRVDLNEQCSLIIPKQAVGYCIQRRINTLIVSAVYISTSYTPF